MLSMNRAKIIPSSNARVTDWFVVDQIFRYYRPIFHLSLIATDKMCAKRKNKREPPPTSC